MAYFDAVDITVTRDDNTTFKFTGRPEADDLFGITQLLGIEFPEIEVFTQPKGLGDGVFFTGQRLQPRTIEIHSKLPGRTPADNFKGRRDALDFFLANHTYKLTVNVTDPGDSQRTRVLNDCRLIAASYPTIDASDTNPDMVLQFMAPEAYFEATGINSGEEILNSQSSGTITYEGDAAAPVVIDLECTAGSGVYGTTVSVALNNSWFSIWKSDVSEWVVGDTIQIDSNAVTASYNGTDFPVTDTEAAKKLFYEWKLIKGTNTLRVSNPNGTAKFNATVTYNARYNGI